MDFETDFWLPHFTAYIQRVRGFHPEAIAFVQPPVFHEPPKIPSSLLGHRACYAPHFYDGLTLITRHWWWFNAEPVGLLRGKYPTLAQALCFGESRVRNSLACSLAILKDDVKIFGPGNEMPSLVGEIGIPFDLVCSKHYLLLRPRLIFDHNVIHSRINGRPMATARGGLARAIIPTSNVLSTPHCRPQTTRT